MLSTVVSTPIIVIVLEHYCKKEHQSKMSLTQYNITLSKQVLK